jgi:hypothetical protein
MLKTKTISLQFLTVEDGGPVIVSKQSLFKLRLLKIDRTLLVLFLMVFGVFNAIYWPVCLWAIEQNTNTTLI